MGCLGASAAQDDPTTKTDAVAGCVLIALSWLPTDRILSDFVIVLLVSVIVLIPMVTLGSDECVAKAFGLTTLVALFGFHSCSIVFIPSSILAASIYSSSRSTIDARYVIGSFGCVILTAIREHRLATLIFELVEERRRTHNLLENLSDGYCVVN